MRVEKDKPFVTTSNSCVPPNKILISFRLSRLYPAVAKRALTVGNRSCVSLAYVYEPFGFKKGADHGRILLKSNTSPTILPALGELILPKFVLKSNRNFKLLVACTSRLDRRLYRLRSEERRVGKECRSRWSRYD